jgi:arylsulfatase A-like enzyme
MREYFQQYFANVANREREEDWFSPQVFTCASEILEAGKGQQPFFLVVDNYDPHAPYDPPEEYVNLYDEPYEGLEPYSPRYGASSYLTDRQLQRIRALYAAEVTMMDRWLGRFLDKIEELNPFENTFLILLSDYGVAHGKHGILGKPLEALYPELTDIVFMMRHPEGKGAGRTSDFYASTHDVAPTILGFLGVEPEQPMDGKDLSVIFDGDQPQERNHFTLGYDDHVRAMDRDYAMISRNDRLNPLLYDLNADPRMHTDIAKSNQDILNRMWNNYVLKDAGGPLPDYDG